MIELYSGTPGSGKSLHVARTIYYRLRSRKPCICNFHIRTDLVPSSRLSVHPFHYVPNSRLSPSYLIEFSQKWFYDELPREDEILLVIDEAQILFNSRDWSSAGRSEWLTFFSQHRKLGYHVILVSQYDEMLDKQIRAVLEHEVIHRKLSNFGIKGFFMRVCLFGSGFMLVRVWYPLQTKIDSEVMRYCKKFASLYDTYATFGR